MQICSGKNDSILLPEKNDLSSMVNLIATYRLSIIKIIKANVKLIRGNLCSLCVPPTSYKDYFVVTTTKLMKLRTDDIDSYTKVVGAELLNL